MKRQYTYRPYLALIMCNAIALLMFMNAGCGSQYITEMDECTDIRLLNFYDVETLELYIEDGIELTPIAWTAQISGENYSSTHVSDDGSIYRLVSISGKPIAVKDPGDKWRILNDIIPPERGFPFTLETRCPDVTGRTNAGSELVDGTPVTRYTSPNKNNGACLGPFSRFKR